MNKREFKKKIRKIDFSEYSCFQIDAILGKRAYEVYNKEFALNEYAFWVYSFLRERDEWTEENKYLLRQLLIGMFEEFCIRERLYEEF